MSHRYLSIYQNSKFPISPNNTVYFINFYRCFTILVIDFQEHIFDYLAKEGGGSSLLSNIQLNFNSSNIIWTTRICPRHGVARITGV